MAKKKSKKQSKKQPKHVDPNNEGKSDDEEEPSVRWGKSEARDKLYDMLLKGELPSAEEMKPKAIYLQYLKHLPEFAPFQDYTALQFATKLSSTRLRVSKKVDRAAEDLKFFEHDRALFPLPEQDTKGQPMWKGSTARDLLRKRLDDIASGKKEYQKPRFLYQEHEEWHKNYSLEFFRKKIYQEMKYNKRQAWLEDKYGRNNEKEEDDDSSSGGDEDE